jgi:hypothetical protein
MIKFLSKIDFFLFISIFYRRYHYLKEEIEMRLFYTSIFLLLLLIGCIPKDELLIAPGAVSETIVTPLSKNFNIATVVHLEFSNLPSEKLTYVHYQKIRPDIVKTIYSQSSTWDIPQTDTPGNIASQVIAMDTKAFCEAIKNLSKKDVKEISILECSMKVEKRIVSDI